MNLRAFRCLVVLMVFSPLLATIVGCGRPSGAVQETSELSYEDVAAQIGAEEAASKHEREKSR